VFTAKRNIETIRSLDRIVGEIEQEVASQIKIKKEFIKLLTTPGIGNILGLIRLEEHRLFSGPLRRKGRCFEVKNTIA
jgi:hypothetical protein